MKQAVKATALVMLVSLLSGCSSAEAKACEINKAVMQHHQIEANKWNEAYKAKKLGGIKATLQAGELGLLGIKENLKAQKIVANNPNCFTDKELETALYALEKYKEFIE